MTNQKDPVLSPADGNKFGALTPSSTSNDGTVPDTPLSQVSTKAHGNSSTGRRRIVNGVGSTFVVEHSSAKRRRVSDEENMNRSISPACVNLLRSFDSASSYRQQATDSDDDSDEEDDVEEKHEKGKRTLLLRIKEANEKSVSMEGDCSVVLLQIPRAKCYEMKGGSWICKGLVSIKFLKNVEQGEYWFGMVSMSIKAENSEEATTIDIDEMPVSVSSINFVSSLNDTIHLHLLSARHSLASLSKLAFSSCYIQATRMQGDRSGSKPMYVWRARGTPTYALRFASIDDGLRW
eukprot:CAMPEP_0178712024 /NCGR_PEP_ID=MMETSP0699-20121125/18657_1 /TAXON_ID=265572 /ORGANISM="Extubocellulus spinifer, Strain CCMP396" /LENGTH=291 /DNA_ID=CAMNT_0020360739 /DNA_START=553 /DNA_END=1425 /DNA_ORIENTATION=-